MCGSGSNCAREGLVLTLGNTALPRGWADTETDFLESGLLPQACLCVKGILTMPLIICFTFW